LFFGVAKIGVLWLALVGLNEWISQAAEYLLDAPVPAHARVLIDGLFLGLAVGQIIKRLRTAQLPPKGED
jgi:hypothetical protein